MSLENWRNSGWLTSHQSSRQEIADLLAIVDRDLRDCGVERLSADWRFNIAYNALLQSAAAALAAAGYRAGRESHHYRVLQSLEFTAGLEKSALRQLDAFRKKRNVTGYERMGAVSDGEVEEMVEQARTVRQKVEAWIRKTHPDLL
jgi:hypothetical protein